MGYGQYSPSGLGGRNEVDTPAKKGRTKSVFGSHAQTAHVWAQQEYSYGRSGDGRMFFHDATIYSYGTHFPIASFVGEHDRRRVVLFNRDSYSSSTGKHKGEARHALRGTDIVIPVSTDFIRYGHRDKQERRSTFDSLLESYAAAMRNVTFDSLLESYAAAMRNVAAPSRWDETGEHAKAQLNEALTALDAYRSIYKIKWRVPGDVVAWSDERATAAARKALLSKVADARKVALQCRNMQMREEWLQPPPADFDAGRISMHLADMARAATPIYAARNVLARAKADKRLIRYCSTAIATLQKAKREWETARAKQSAIEAREERLVILSRIENDKDCVKHSYRWSNIDWLGDLWAFAIAEGRALAAERIGAEVHQRQWIREVPDIRAAQRDRNTLTVDDWINGAGNANDVPHAASRGRIMIRRKGDALQTTMGAECPFDHAVAAFRMSQRCRSHGEAWERNGHSIRVGHFSVDRIDADGTLHAGCHTIDYPEMLRLAVREVPDVVEATYPLPVPACG